MNKKTASKAGRFIVELVQYGVISFSDDIFEGKCDGLTLTSLSLEDAQKLFYVGDRVFHYWYDHTSYDLLAIADQLILVISDPESQVYNSVDVTGM